MKVCISGASGFLGSALSRHLTGAGHDVVRLVRRPVQTADESSWDPTNGQIDPGVIEQSDVVVNLAGASFVRWPWTNSYKDRIRRSRIDSTRTIADAVALADEPPALLNGSGISIYGDDRGEEVLDETSSRGSGFLADVVEQWEDATAPARSAGARVCLLRTSAAIHRAGGPLKPMAIPFRLGLGGPVGDGSKYFSVLSRHDWLRAVEFLATADSAAGPYDLACPDAPTNGEFSRALADALGRPMFMRAPELALKAVVGDLSSLLLGSMRVRPTRLLEAGFVFEDPSVQAIVRRALSE